MKTVGRQAWLNAYRIFVSAGVAALIIILIITAIFLFRTENPKVEIKEARGVVVSYGSYVFLIDTHGEAYDKDADYKTHSKMRVTPNIFIGKDSAIGDADGRYALVWYAKPADWFSEQSSFSPVLIGWEENLITVDFPMPE
ncbi:MAG: hypothetical protein LBC95_01895 [Candidatus Nomurabacteria bacterium]|nr:hypothetical protein [Candidatus Nomurabacteria bacterium]